MELDETDKKIIQEIMKNPKITDSELADKIDLSRSGTAKRRKKLEDNDEIQYYASPNLRKVSDRVITGRLGLNPKVNREKAIETAENISERDEILSCWVRRVSDENWGIVIVAFSDKLKNKAETDQMIEDMVREVHRATGERVWIDIGDLVTYFIKMLGQDIQGDKEYV